MTALACAAPPPKKKEGCNKSAELLEGVLTTYVLTFDGSQLDIAFEDNRGVRLRVHGQTVD